MEGPLASPGAHLLEQSVGDPMMVYLEEEVVLQPFLRASSKARVATWTQGSASRDQYLPEAGYPRCLVPPCSGDSIPNTKSQSDVAATDLAIKPFT